MFGVQFWKLLRNSEAQPKFTLSYKKTTCINAVMFACIIICVLLTTRTEGMCSSLLILKKPECVSFILSFFHSSQIFLNGVI